MFTSLRVHNFKSYSDSGHVPLRPLTLIVGANNAGKSSLLQSILLLAQTVEDRVWTQPLVTSGSLVDLGGFLDILRGGSGASKNERAVTLELSMGEDSADAVAFFRPKEMIRPIDLKVSFTFDPTANQIHVSTVKVSAGSEDLASARRSGRGYTTDLLTPAERKNVQIMFRHFLPLIYRSGNNRLVRLGKIVEVDHAFDQAHFAWSSVLGNVNHIGPIRVPVPRFGILGKTPPSELGPGGENLLRALRETNGGEQGDLVENVSDWLSNRLKLLARLRLVNVDKSGTVLSLLGDEREGFSSINVANMGEGISQLLPIIVMVLTTPQDACLLIEQPEIHLHPAAQADLADLFVRNARTGSRQYIIETHSEHLLLRLRRRIAEGEIDPARVAILYVERKKGGSTVRNLDLNSKGTFEDWPEGFFDERYQESLKIAEAAAKTT